LFIASTLAERCGGDLIVDTNQLSDDKTKNPYTRFTLSLPLDNRS